LSFYNGCNRFLNELDTILQFQNNNIGHFQNPLKQSDIAIANLITSISVTNYILHLRSADHLQCWVCSKSWPCKSNMHHLSTIRWLIIRFTHCRGGTVVNKTQVQKIALDTISG